MVAEQVHESDRTATAGETAVERANYIRAHLLTWMIGSWNHFAAQVAELGFSAEPGYALIGEALARVDESLAEFACPLCALQESPEANCLCGGRGYFTKVESDRFALAMSRMPRAATGDVRPVGRVLRDLAKAMK